MVIKDKTSGFEIADLSAEYFHTRDYTDQDLEKALETLILSASGWRKVFAENGDEESTTTKIKPVDQQIVATMALVYSRFLKQKSGKENPTVVVGMDARHTGPVMADIMTRVFLGDGLNVQYLFITAAPEIMSYAKLNSEADGFAYISASHNPIGHNGLKFGLSDGGVIGGSDAAGLINDFKTAISDDNNFEIVKNLCGKANGETLKKIYNATADIKAEALKEYHAFSKLVITDSADSTQAEPRINAIQSAAKSTPIGVIAELNGSARTISIDQDFFSELGAKIIRINEIPRQITHRIVPEGESLNLCRQELEKANKKDSAFQLGYVPDNDGDRGNVVYMDGSEAKILEAQEVFALACLSELAYLLYNQGEKDSGLRKAAVVVNGPTSLRIEAIARAFGAKVFRAEVGEANVVNLARDLRKAGYIVRILGEGSNGGNITYPASVRDPLNTVCAFIKLLTLKSDGNNTGLFELWCQNSGQMDAYKENFNIADVLATLPQFCSTSAYEPHAVVDIKTTDHGKLKANYEAVYPDEWEANKEYLKKELNIHSWREINYEGKEEKHGVGSRYRSGAEKGGFKILFKDDQGVEVGYIWMRGSGTEPVFRVLADIKGNNWKHEEWLLNWHVKMIHEADRRS